jgi:hypothetical protein
MSAAAERIAFPVRYAGEKLLALGKTVLDSAFQPIVEVTTGATFGYETLLRGHEQLGFDSPLDLIDRLAETGQLAALEQMMSGRALAKFTSISGYRSSTLFINLDFRLIPQGSALLDILLQHLRVHGIPPSSICFELSERYDNTDIPEFAELFAKMRGPASRSRSTISASAAASSSCSATIPSTISRSTAISSTAWAMRRASSTSSATSSISPIRSASVSSPKVSKRRPNSWPAASSASTWCRAGTSPGPR